MRGLWTQRWVNIFRLWPGRTRALAYAGKWLQHFIQHSDKITLEVRVEERWERSTGAGPAGKHGAASCSHSGLVKRGTLHLDVFGSRSWSRRLRSCVCLLFYHGSSLLNTQEIAKFKIKVVFALVYCSKLALLRIA
jgi:hypothetical protein